MTGKRQLSKISAIILAAMMLMGTITPGIGVAYAQLDEYATEDAVPYATAAPLAASATENTISWTPVSPQTPFGSVADFGVFVFGNIEATYADVMGGGHMHVEGGVAVRGNLLLTRANADFGRVHGGVGIQMPHTDRPRTVIGGDLISYQEPAGVAFSLSVYGGGLLLNQDTVTEVPYVIHTHVRYTPPPPSYIIFGPPDHPDVLAGWMPSFDGIPRAPAGNIQAFFDAALVDLTGLSDLYADPDIGNVPGIFRTVLNDEGRVDMPASPSLFHTIVVDIIMPAGGDLPPVTLDMQAFDGVYVINVPNSTQVSVVADTFFVGHPPPVANHYALAREFSHRILWNFTGSGTITHNNFSTVGTVLAPRADFIALVGGNVGGLLIVNNFIHGANSFEQHTVSRLQQINPPVWPPTNGNGGNGNGGNGNGGNGNGGNGNGENGNGENGNGENGNGENGNGENGNGENGNVEEGGTAAADSGIPRTGDNSSIGLWLILILSSAAALGAMIIKLRQRKVF